MLSRDAIATCSLILASAFSLGALPSCAAQDDEQSVDAELAAARSLPILPADILGTMPELAEQGFATTGGGTAVLQRMANYRAYRFRAKAGDDLLIRFSVGKPDAALLTSTFRVLKEAYTWEGGEVRISARIPSDGDYYVAFRDREQRPSTFLFTVSTVRPDDLPVPECKSTLHPSAFTSAQPGPGFIKRYQISTFERYCTSPGSCSPWRTIVPVGPMPLIAEPFDSHIDLRLLSGEARFALVDGKKVVQFSSHIENPWSIPGTPVCNVRVDASAQIDLIGTRNSPGMVRQMRWRQDGTNCTRFTGYGDHDIDARLSGTVGDDCVRLVTPTRVVHQAARGDGSRTRRETVDVLAGTP